MSDFAWSIVAAVVKSIIAIVALLTAFAYMTLIERRVIARFQRRLGPNRAGPFGLLQPLADAIKMAFKEQITPAKVRRVVFVTAPAISVFVALTAFAVVPLGDTTTWGTSAVARAWAPFVADINVGILYILAISSLAVYGIVLGGWSSGNHYSLLGALRSAAQMVSYEVSIGLALAGVLMFSGTLSMVGIVHAQVQQGIWFVLAQPLGLVLYRHRLDRRGQPRALRSAGGRAGAGGWLPHRVQRAALEPLPDGRVHQHDHGKLGS